MSTSWVEERLDITLDGLDGSDLVGLALRRNPRRAHLLVSSVLGKHVPAPPAQVIGVATRLGERVRDIVGDADGVVVLGFAETATGLGHCVSDVLDATYLHTTRRDVPVPPGVGPFEEGHSHATTHLLLAEDPRLLAGDGPVVLVDDELSTGSTAMNLIAELQAFHPRAHYVIAALLDVRGPEDRARLQALGAEVGARVDVVSLAQGEVGLGADVLRQGQALVEEHDTPLVPPAGPPAEVARLTPPWPAGLRDGGRHGFGPDDRRALEAALPGLAAAVVGELEGVGSVHVLGHEELMYLPLRLADALQRGLDHAEVTFSSTTRSPVLAVEDEGYAVRSALTFAAHDDPSDGPGPRFAYNLQGPGGAIRFEAVVLVVDDVADTAALGEAGGLLDQLRRITGRVVVVTVPSHRPALGPVPLPLPLHGPEFGSYPAADVAWLLTDLSGAALEAPVEEREEAIQSGGAHYSESLPIEYQPSQDYQALYEAALAAGAARVAVAVGTVTELALAERGHDLVLASLARAGTPVGILMRRWAAQVHGLDLPHYAVSIIRGRGIDPVAMAHLARHHDPAQVLFVDGWTGKGAIARELETAVLALNRELGTAFVPDLAVLADPGRCVRLFGTRDDFLIPSACLNSTVSGLVSRTVLNRALIGPGDFHGAKFYADLADRDVSVDFVEAVAAEFAGVRTQAVEAAERLRGTDRTPTWSGWRSVERIVAEHDLGDVNLAKPGVGETTRVLLRRVPWKILVSPGSESELAHVRALAAERGVPLEEVDGLPYSCVGLIHPRFTRGAVGADGRAAAGVDA